jgi:glyoxylase-like metal-dependent hydrolase (beta-lactamase superfamily II)
MNIIKLPLFGNYRYDRKLLEAHTREAFAVLPPTQGYILESRGEAALINAPGNTRAVLDILGDRGLTLSSILLTNARFEHLYGLEEIARKTGAPVYIHKKDIAVTTQYAEDIKKLLALEIPPAYQGAFRSLDEGSLIEVGHINLRVYHTPGMTAGSVCYITEGALFSGDLLGNQTVRNPDLPGSNPQNLLKSLERLRDMEGDYAIYPSHWGATTLKRERETNLAMLPQVRVGIMVSLKD